jgi:hypothetical protein
MSLSSKRRTSNTKNRTGTRRNRSSIGRRFRGLVVKSAKARHTVFVEGDDLAVEHRAAVRQRR